MTRHDVRSAAYSASSVGLRVLGVVSAAGGMMVGGFLALVGGYPEGVVPGLIAGAAGLTVAGFSWFAGGRLSKQATDADQLGREMSILKLAGASGGTLFVTDVARSLGISLAEADRVLSGMVDGTRVVAEVTDDGLLRFEFRELRVRAPRIEARVVDESAAHAAQAASEATAQAETTSGGEGSR